MALELLHIRPNINLLSKGRAVLDMQMPVRLSNLAGTKVSQRSDLSDLAKGNREPTDSGAILPSSAPPLTVQL